MGVVRKYKEMFAKAAGTDENAVILSPGVSGMVMMLSTEAFEVSEEAVQGVYDAESWNAEHDVNYEDFLILVRAVGRKEDCESDMDGEVDTLVKKGFVYGLNPPSSVRLGL